MSHFSLPADLHESAGAAELLADIRNSSGQILRYMMFDANGIKHLADDDSIGLHWTTDASDMSFDALRIPPDADNTWRTYQVVGKIDDISAVDLDATLSQRRQIPWEREVVLREDATVKIVSVHLYDEQNHRPLELVRADLQGIRLKAASPDHTLLP